MMTDIDDSPTDSKYSTNTGTAGRLRRVPRLWLGRRFVVGRKTSDDQTIPFRD
jgi:hypothetical protein